MVTLFLQNLWKFQISDYTACTGVYDTTGNAIRRPISPVDVLEGVEAVISCLEAVLENEDHSDPDS